ncbi:four helix bundle protein [Candidatus Parcubacteria bacterium]|nr:four helix bundle protein [Candidatus Parcubacteria bacterium]
MENQEFKIMLINKSYNFSLEMMNFIDTFSQKDLSIQILSKQIIRSATSIGANIIEAQAASSKKDFTNFMSYALKSANETRYWLGLLRDSNKVDKNKANKLLKEVQELSKILGSTILSLKNRK